jgi:methyltransferase (TIGR00027 family)
VSAVNGGWDIASGAGVTALGLAAARSVESGREDRLITDPFARGLFLAAGVTLPMRLDWPAERDTVSDTEAFHLHGSRYIGLRTRVYDDVLLAAATAGTRQAVIVGAGLDTRAFRVPLPASMHVFELDQPGVLSFKAEALAGQGATTACRHSAVAVDLRDDWPAALLDAGFDHARASAWIAEGVLAYLPADAQVGLIERVRRLAAPGSVIALDRIIGDPTAGDRLRELSQRSGIAMERLLAEGTSSDPAAVLRAAGWSVEERTVTALAERYGRELGDPFAADPEQSGADREQSGADRERSGADGEQAGAEADRPPAAEPPWLDTVFVTARLAA